MDPGEVDGLVFDASTTTGAWWPQGEPVPADFLAAFANTSNPMDGLVQLGAEWLIKNMPELTGLKFAMTAAGCMSRCASAAAEAVGRGMGSVVLSVKGWHNVPGRYGQRGANAQDTVSGPGKYGTALAGPPVYGTAVQFERYLHKYGKTHDMMAPFVVNSRANGLKFPEGYWSQHRPTPLTSEEYRESRWVAEPANLYDNDIPIHTAAAYLFATAERAKDMRQPPAYVLGHAGANFQGRAAPSTRWKRPRSGRRTPPGGSMSPRESRAADMDFENTYDGFSLFHVFQVEGFGFAGIKEGEALDFFQTRHQQQRADPGLAQRREHRQRPDPVLDVDRHHPADPGPGRGTADKEGRTRRVLRRPNGREQHVRRVQQGPGITGNRKPALCRSRAHGGGGCSASVVPRQGL